jgi:hypothetical protein
MSLITAVSNSSISCLLILYIVQAIPLYNYPNFLNLFSLLVYVILCFAYIIAVSNFGTSITAEQTQVPKRTFALFGLLDTLSISM